MKTNEELPSVHSVGLTSRNLHLPTAREAIEDRTPNNNDAPPHYESEEEANENLTLNNETIPNCNSEDDTISILDSEDENVRIFDSDDESDNVFIFEDKNTRIAFIQKVLAVKLLQILTMTAIIAVFALNITQWRIDSIWNSTITIHLIVLTILGFFVTNFVTFGLIYGRNIESARRKNAFRYMFLIVYPLRWTALIIICTLCLDNVAALTSVLFIFIYYCVVVFALLVYSIFAFQTNLEFTTRCGIIVAICVHIIMCATTIPVIVSIDYYYWDINCVFIFVAAFLLVFEYIYIIFIIEAMTSKGYWRYTPIDCLDGAINLQMDYFFLFRKSVVSKALDMFKEHIKTFKESLEVRFCR